MRTECLVEGAPSTTVEVKVRFLQMAERESWQEGKERDATIPPATLESLVEQPHRREFLMMSGEDAEGRVCETIHGELELRAVHCEDAEAFKVTAPNPQLSGPRSGCRPHARRGVTAIYDFRTQHSACDGRRVHLSARSAGALPVRRGILPQQRGMAGAGGRRRSARSGLAVADHSLRLSPDRAGERGRSVDGTEIDEILALRILTMTDAEKLEVRNWRRARAPDLGTNRNAAAGAFSETARRVASLRPAPPLSREASQ